MQLLSLLTEIGEALIKQSVSDMGPTWDISRIVNYHTGLGRMTFTPPAGSDDTQMKGAIFLQLYSLADGSLCLKASLSWFGTEPVRTMTVFSKPGLHWRTATGKIAANWLMGPPSEMVSMTPAESAGESIDLNSILAAAN